MDLLQRQRKRAETAVWQERLRQLERELEDAKRVCVCVYVSGNVCVFVRIRQPDHLLPPPPEQPRHRRRGGDQSPLLRRHCAGAMTPTSRWPAPPHIHLRGRAGRPRQWTVLVFFFFALFLSQQQEQKAEPGEGLEANDGKEAEIPTHVWCATVLKCCKVVQSGPVRSTLGRPSLL